MKTQILITSYLPDREWLEFNLRSIRKFATGFDDVVIVVPTPQCDNFTPLAEKYGVRLRLRRSSPNPVDDHNQHQVAKLCADEYCENSDLILHTDSDCIFVEPVTPDDYMPDGKPELLINKFENVGAAICWRAGVNRALGINATYETMRRHPAVHYAGVYPELRTLIAAKHKMTMEQYLVRPHAQNERPSEFNILGNFVLMTPRWRERYQIIDLSKEKPPASSRKLIQFWSLSPPDKPQKSPCDGTVCRPIDVINRILG